MARCGLRSRCCVLAVLAVPVSSSSLRGIDGFAPFFVAFSELRGARQMERFAACVFKHLPQVVFHPGGVASEFFWHSQLQIQEAAERRAYRDCVEQWSPGILSGPPPRKVGGRGVSGVRCMWSRRGGYAASLRVGGAAFCRPLSRDSDAPSPTREKEATCTTARTLRARSTIVQTRAVPALTAHARTLPPWLSTQGGT